jgi:hypothetical protein
MHSQPKAILVTGLPRSGTTFVGRVLAVEPTVDYLWEPFNSRFRAGVEQHYPYVGESTTLDKRSKYRRLVADTIALHNLRPAVFRSAPRPSHLRLALKVARGWHRVAVKRRRSPDLSPGSLVIKDPVAIFLSGFLAREFEARVVIVVRHPMALHEAWKSLGWRHDFTWWTSQEDLSVDRLTQHAAALSRIADDPIAQTAYLWRIAYEYSLELAELLPDHVRIVRHEDLCVDPIGGFRAISSHCGLHFSDRVEHTLRELTGGTQVDRKSKDLARLEHRDASRLAEKWKEPGDQHALDRLHSLIGVAADTVYPEDTWWTIDRTS